jgi:nicotinamidase-related amidase
MNDTHKGDFSRTAVLAMDFQTLGVAMVVKDPALMDRVANVLAAARGARLPVIYVSLEFRPGHPEIHPRNAGLVNGIKKHGLFVAGKSGTETHASIAPQPEDIHVVKRRISAFSGSDLAMVLHSHQIEHLILMGIATSGVVLSTVRDAFDADYRMTLVKDCCADPDPELHQVLIDKVLSRQASAVTAEDIIGQLRSVS